jgi:hypothetical protein
MANFNLVNKGDLISANYFNQIFTSFDQRISALEASIGTTSGAMTITGISPSSPHMGDLVTVVGQNFGLPSQVVVSINGTIVTGSNFLPGSGNNTLMFQMPTVPGITSPTGQLVTMIVSNPTTSANFQFTLQPFVLSVPTGQIAATMTGAPSVNPIVAGASYTFTFTITATTSLADTYTLAANLDTASKAAGWTVATVDPNSGNAKNQLDIAAGTNSATPIGVKLTIPATAGVASGVITLTVISSTNPTGLFGAGTTTVTVGAAPPPPNTIAITVLAVTPLPSGVPLSGTNLTPSSVTMPHGTTSAVMAIQAVCPNADSYAITGPTLGAGWAGNVVSVSGASTPGGGGSSPFTTTLANATVLIKMSISTVPAGPAATSLKFQVQSTSPANANIIGEISPSINVL